MELNHEVSKWLEVSDYFHICIGVYRSHLRIFKVMKCNMEKKVSRKPSMKVRNKRSQSGHSNSRWSGRVDIEPLKPCELRRMNRSRDAFVSKERLILSLLHLEVPNQIRILWLRGVRIQYLIHHKFERSNDPARLLILPWLSRAGGIVSSMCR